jgi:hypothetical protein
MLLMLVGSGWTAIPVPVPPTKVIVQTGVVKKAKGKVMAMVGVIVGVPADVTVNPSNLVAPVTAETPLPAAPVVPHPVLGVMLAAA